MNWAISDIHGCYDIFMMLKNKIEKKDKDAVIIIAGDIFDRGTQVSVILEWCMKNCNKTDGKYILLMGNHEEMALVRYEDVFSEKIKAFLTELPFYFIVNTGVKKYLIVHAWAPAKKRMDEILAGSDITENDKAIFLWERRDEETYSDKEVCLVHGHTPTINGISKKKGKVHFNDNTINIDCGCVFREVGGRLAALCLETGEIIYQ